jgi:hypothetical protein
MGGKNFAFCSPMVKTDVKGLQRFLAMFHFVTVQEFPELDLQPKEF